MLGIEKVLREAHASGKCRWGCPTCAEEAKKFDGQEVTWFQKGKRSFRQYYGVVRATEGGVATIEADTGHKVQVAVSGLTLKKDAHPDALWLLAYGGYPIPESAEED
jgi:hypothetical protein